MIGEPALSRRAVLRGGVASGLSAFALPALTGCTSTAHRATRRTPGEVGTANPVDTTAPVSADVALLARSLADERRLLHYCSKTAARHPNLTAELEPVRRLLRTHVAVMRRALPRSRATRNTSPVRVPRRSAAARAELLRSLRRAQRSRLADCLAAQSGRLGRMFAAASASHASVVELLTGPR